MKALEQLVINNSKKDSFIFTKKTIFILVLFVILLQPLPYVKDNGITNQPISNTIKSTPANSNSNLLEKNDHSGNILSTNGMTSLPSSPMTINGNTELANASSSGKGIKSDPYIIKDLNIAGPGAAYNDLICLHIENTTAYLLLQNITATGCMWGIGYDNVSYTTVMNSHTYGNIFGIGIGTSFNNTIVNNHSYNNKQTCIFVYDSFKNNISFNSIEGCSNGFGVNTNSTLNYFGSNTINNMYLGFNVYGNAINNTFDNNTMTNSENSGYYTDKGADNNTIINNHAFNDLFGFKILSNSNYLSNNEATNNTADGFFVFYGNNTVLNGNQAYDSSLYGIIVDDTYNSSIVNNLVENNNASTSGIFVDYSFHTQIKNNSASNNGQGFYQLNARYSTYEQNLATNNYNGYFITSSNGDTFNDNTAKNNKGYGFTIMSSSNEVLENNMAISNGQGQFSASKSTNITSKSNSWDPATSSSSSSSTSTSSLSLDIIYPMMALYVVVLLKRRNRQL